MAYTLYCNGVPADTTHFPVILQLKKPDQWRPRRFTSFWRAQDHAVNWMFSAIPLITGKPPERLPRQFRPNDPYKCEGYTVEIRESKSRNKKEKPHADL